MRDTTIRTGPTYLLRCALACFCFFSSVQAVDRLNVLLVTVDTFRPDHLSGYGYARQTTPYLDSLAADGALFEEAISSSSWTTPGLISVQTGLWAPTHGVDVRGKSLNPGTPTFATELTKAGYVTPDILYLSSIPNLQNLGLTKTYSDRDKYLPDGDRVLFEALETYKDSTFYLYYHYRNLHLPYNPSEPYDRLFTDSDFDRDGFTRERVASVRENVTIPLGTLTFSPSDSTWVRGLYDGQLREMDETFFRPLIQKLKALGLYDRTLVIVTADHGEELLEHGFIGHPSTSFRGSAYEEQIRIPLIMTCPAAIPGGARVRSQVQNVDILPTALDFLGLPIPQSVQGRSVREVISGRQTDERPAYTETTQGGYQSTPDMMKVRVRAHRAPPWKLIHTLGPGIDRYELYNLEDDPSERRDVSGEQPEILTRMRGELHAWALSSIQRRETPAETSFLKHEGEIEILFPGDGDTLRYVDGMKTVDVRWSGTEDAAYVIEYRVGEGNYHLEGTIPVEGLTSTHGPFTEEMWNMLTLYNPFSFRVVARGGSAATPWSRFVIDPTSGEFQISFFHRWVAGIPWAASEVSLLVIGLWTGLWLVLETVGTYALSDVLGWGLVGVLITSIAGSAVVRWIGLNRAWAWGIVVGYTGLIYATLSVAPELWGTAYRLTHGRITYVAPILAIGVGLWLVARIVSFRLRWAAVAVIVVSGIYVWLLVWLSQSPAERFHLVEYGLLSYLTFRACRVDVGCPAALVTGLLIAAALGTGDELIQWGLPNRVFEWKDIWLNIGSSCLGMSLVYVLGLGESREVS